VCEAALLEEVGGFEESFWRGEDMELWLRLAISEPELGYNRTVGAIYKHRQDGLTSTDHLPQFSVEVLLAYYRRIHSHLLDARGLQPAERRKWFTPLAWRMIRRLALHGEGRAAETLREELRGILTGPQRWVLKSISRRPERVEAWYRRRSVVRGLIGV